MKALLIELLKLYVEKEETHYGIYLANILITIGLFFLVMTNYFYFYEPNQEIAGYLAVGSGFIFCGILIRCLNCWLKSIARKKSLEKFESASEIINALEKQLAGFISIKTLLQLLPLVIRILPISTAMIIIGFILKKKFASKVDNITKTASH